MGHIRSSSKKTLITVRILEEKLALSFHGIFCQYQDLYNYEKLQRKVHLSVIRQLIYKMCFAENSVKIGEVWLGVDLCIFFFSFKYLSGIFCYCYIFNKSLKERQ